jgi:hypothetical protein
MHAMTDESDRSTAPDEGRASHVSPAATVRPRPPCGVCGRPGSKRRRRRACIACVRKLTDCSLPLPPAALPGPRPRDPLLWLMDRMTPAQRDKARIYLGELARRDGADDPDPTP